MAQRRMFSQKIVSSDAFLEMPTSSRELYFQLGMYADDDGFVSPKKIMRMVGASDDDIKVLLSKRFVIGFENGVIVIKHWKINNLIRKDFYQETTYIEQRNMLEIKDNKSYTERKQIVNNLSPQYRLGKYRLGKDTNTAPEEPDADDVQVIPEPSELRSRKETFELPDWLDKEVWAEWVSYRASIRKKLTMASIKLQIRMLDSNRSDHVAIIENSIKNGWTGLFPLDPRKNPQQKPVGNVWSDKKSTQIQDFIKSKTK